jgi:hypothetical protein
VRETERHWISPRPSAYTRGMARPPSPAPSGFREKLTTTFEVGAHTLHVTKVMEGRWTVTVDSSGGSASYMTQAEAWEAGVREAARLDRLSGT